MNEKLFMFIHCLKFHQIIHHTTASTHQQLATSTHEKDILGSWLIACCKRTPTLARKYDVIITSSAAMNIEFLHFRIYCSLGIFTAIFV